MTFIIEINLTDWSYLSESGAWLDGDRRELGAETDTITPDEDDLELWSDCPDPAVAWAVEIIRTKTDAVSPSSYPIGDAVPEHAWLHGSYQDPYLGEDRVTETSVYVRGDYTDQQRAEIFSEVLKIYS